MNGSTVTLIDRYYWVGVRLKPVFDGEIFENLKFFNIFPQQLQISPQQLQISPKSSHPLNKLNFSLIFSR